MCDPVTLTAIAVGASVGAGTAAATGGDPLTGALMGGATGAFFPGGFGVGGSFLGPGGAAAGAFNTGFGSSIVLSGVGQAVGVGLLGGSILNPLLNPPSYDLPAQATPVAFQSNQTIATTGSGGKAAASSLAEAVRRSKQRKLTQDDVADLSIDTSSFASQGLQLA